MKDIKVNIKLHEASPVEINGVRKSVTSWSIDKEGCKILYDNIPKMKLKLTLNAYRKLCSYLDTYHPGYRKK